MFRSQLFWRLYAGYVVVILISTLIVGVLISKQVEHTSLIEIEHSLAMNSELLVEVVKPTLQHLSQTSIDSPYQSALHARILNLGSLTQSRLTVITQQGKVVADSQEDPRKMDNHLTRPEIISAGKQDYATASRLSLTLQQNMLYLARAVYDEQRVLGFVRLSLPLTSIDHKLAELKLNVFYGICFAAVAALLLGFFFANRFLSPLVNMTEVADAISKGDYDRRIHIDQNDEMGRLAKSVNRMALSSIQRMEEITQDRNRLAKILTGMVEGVIYVDEKQRIQHINQAAEAMLSLRRSECINARIWEQVRIQEINVAVEQALESGQAVKTNINSKASGDAISESAVVMNIYAAAMLNDEGRSIGVVVVLHDISELAYLERIRRDFVANASHELKTPITAIRALTETILDDEQMLPEVSRRFTEKISTQSIRLSALVTDLMTLSRLESNESESNYVELDFKALVGRSVTAANIACEEKRINLSSDLCKEHLLVKGDDQALSQLVDNLLDNAVKYSSEGGKVRLELSINAVKEADKTVVLKVSDTGVGISPQYQTRIFERFYRVDKARSRDLGGTGLGLSIVKNIAEQHGGSVSVHSRLGSGSTFTVILPLV